MQIATDQFSWFDVPEQVKQLLIQAAANWENTQESEKYINQALQITNNNIDVLVAAYRYFYYKQNYPMALKTAQDVMQIIQQQENFPAHLEDLKAIIITDSSNQKIRLYLNAYAASAIVLAKLGDIESAKKICIFIKEVDINHDYLSAEILLDILIRPVEEDEAE